MNDDELKKLDSKHIMATYKRHNLLLEWGEGCYVFDQDGKKYLDCIGGIATCSVGHANKEVNNAVSEQANKLISVSNLYFSEPQIQLAKTLTRLSGLKKVFFSHSGTDANEAAIKLARKITGKKEFIAFTDAFHGRTTGSLALTWRREYREPFMPLSPTVKFATYNDIDSLRSLITDDTAAVIIEPIQGEAGIIVPNKTFLNDVRELCTQHNVLMIIDEVQTGVGRTGTFFAYEHNHIKPDIVTLAKGLANGLPIGVCLSDYELEAGEHGSTLGGNSLSAAAASATIHYIEQHKLMHNAETVGNYLMDKLRTIKGIKEVRGSGLMIGAELSEPLAATYVQKAMHEGLLCNAPTPTVLRFLPPLILTKAQADEALAILQKVIQT
jgi:acetylornithine/N-succinyldiaminopimelate aminotransferase